MTKQEIVEIIIRHAREVLETLQGRDIQPTDSMKDLGLNSVDRSDVIMMTLETLSVSIPLIEMARAPNIDELAGIIHGKVDAKP